MNAEASMVVLTFSLASAFSSLPAVGRRSGDEA